MSIILFKMHLQFSKKIATFTNYNVLCFYTLLPKQTVKSGEFFTLLPLSQKVLLHPGVHVHAPLT